MFFIKEELVVIIKLYFYYLRWIDHSFKMALVLGEHGLTVQFLVDTEQGRETELATCRIAQYHWPRRESAVHHTTVQVGSFQKDLQFLELNNEYIKLQDIEKENNNKCTLSN